MDRDLSTSTKILSITYHPQVHGPAPIALRAVAVGEILDGRGKDPRLIMAKLRMGGSAPTGSYASDRPVARIIQEALSEALAGPPQDKKPPLILSGTLLNLDFAVTVGFARGLLKCGLELVLALTDKDALVWEGRFVANGRADTGDLVPGAFAGALDDCIAQLASCQPFLTALQ